MVWARKPSLGSWDIYAQRVDGDGDKVGNTLEICTQTGDQTSPAVAYNPETGYFLVVWEDARGENTDIYALAVNGADGEMGDEFVVYDGEADARFPDVAANEADGKYLVVWQEKSGDDSNISGRRTSTTDTVEDVFAIADGDADEKSPAVSFNEDAEEYLVIWSLHAVG